MKLFQLHQDNKNYKNFKVLILLTVQTTRNMTSYNDKWSKIRRFIIQIKPCKSDIKEKIKKNKLTALHVAGTINDKANKLQANKSE